MHTQASPFSTNLRRLMARLDLTLEGVVDRTGLDERTVKRILNRAGHRPHPHTLHRLASGLGVPADELFLTSPCASERRFDRQTNPAVEDALRVYPELFAGWGEAEFDELYSRFGTGGALTFDGACEAARQMNEKRAVQRKVDLLMETSEAELLASLVDLLYRRTVISDPRRDVAAAVD